MPASSQRQAPEPLPLDPFLQGLSDSGIWSPAEIQGLRAKSAAFRQDCRPLIQELIKNQKLTKFQATLILQGKGRDLVLSNYVILEKIGEGGMGMVFKARHRKTGQVVALKVLSPAVTKKPTAVKRFLREVRAVSELDHTNIVASSDAGEDKGTHFLVMEYVEGTDLTRLVRKNGPLPVDQAVDIVLQAARGLSHAHEIGIIHRDIKPSNLLLDRQGVVKILDLGLALREDEDDSASQQLTRDGSILGTCDYMAPEQALNSRSADQRSDIYSLGCTFYFLLTGQLMYGGQKSTMEKVMAHRESAAPALSGVPSGVQAAYQKMVAKKPEQRWQTMKEVIAALASAESRGAGRRSFGRGLALAASVAIAAAAAAYFMLPASEPVVPPSTPQAKGKHEPGHKGKHDPNKGKPGVDALAVDDAARWQNAINLLALAEPAKERTTGNWRLEGGRLISDATIGAKCSLPYLPPEEYDLRVEFTRLSGKQSVMLALAKSGRLFGWEMGSVLGFNAVDGRGRYVGGKPALETGQPVTAIIQVRNQGLKAYMNGTLVTEISTDYQNLSPPEYWNWSGSRLGVGSWASPTSFSRIEVLDVTGKGTIQRSDSPERDPPAKPPEVVTSPARWRNAINLLSHIEPGRDAVTGKWSRNDFGLVSDRTEPAKLVIPYQPPEEYDFRIVFTRQEGDHSVAQVLSKGGRCFSWEMGVFPNRACTFNMVKGKASNNPTTVPGIDLANGERHVSIVQVRYSGVTAYLDGVLIRDYKTDFRDMEDPYPWKWPNPNCLGLGSWGNPATFHAVDVLEVTGKGKFTRADDPGKITKTKP